MSESMPVFSQTHDVVVLQLPQGGDLALEEQLQGLIPVGQILQELESDA